MNSDELRDWQLRLGFDPDELAQLQPQAPTTRARRSDRGKPPLIRCRCGRLHRSWNPHKVCNRCVSEQRRERDEELRERVLELESRHLHVDVARLTATYERWLARQPADHPWRVEPVAASPASRPSNVSHRVDSPRTVELRSRVAAGGGGA